MKKATRADVMRELQHAVKMTRAWERRLRRGSGLMRKWRVRADRARQRLLSMPADPPGSILAAVATAPPAVAAKVKPKRKIAFNKEATE